MISFSAFYNLQMVWLESPTNPLLKITDIKAVADSLKSHRQDIILVVDNTFLTCYFQVNSTHNSMRKIFRCICKYKLQHKHILLSTEAT